MIRTACICVMCRPSVAKYGPGRFVCASLPGRGRVEAEDGDAPVHAGRDEPAPGAQTGER